MEKEKVSIITDSKGKLSEGKLSENGNHGMKIVKISISKMKVEIVEIPKICFY